MKEQAQRRRRPRPAAGARPAPAWPAAPAAPTPVAPPSCRATGARAGRELVRPLLANPMYWGGGLAALGLGGVLWWMMAGGAVAANRRTAMEDSIMTGGDVRPSTHRDRRRIGRQRQHRRHLLPDRLQPGGPGHHRYPRRRSHRRSRGVHGLWPRCAGRGNPQGGHRQKPGSSRNPRQAAGNLRRAAQHRGVRSGRRRTVAALGSKSSPLWDKACEMGRSIDPTNPLYGGVQSSACPAAAAATVAATAAVAGGAVGFADEPEAEAQSRRPNRGRARG
jgi:pilus assembly protein FimV